MPTTDERLDLLETRLAELSAEVVRLRPAKAWTPTEGVVTGDRVRIHPSCTITASEGRTVTIGDGVLLRRGAELVGPITIGAGSSFNRDAYIRANVTIGRNVNVGAFVRFITDSHEIGNASRRAGKGSFPPILVGDGSWVGANATILGGVTIGESSIIAAGSVVTKDVPAHTMVGGVPARKVKNLPT